MTSRPRREPPRPRPPPPAKLSPPRLAAVLPRPRLFKLLDQAARRPVIWIEGPAGSGKTTLAASWLGRRRQRTLWFQVDARDRDPATFFFHLREGVRRLAPRRREPLPLLTPEYLSGLATYARNFFDGAFARLGAPGVLVLDDFQELPGDAALHRILPEVLGAIPRGVHVLVLSRTAAPPELSRVRANGLVATVGWDALRFTPREATGLLAEHGFPRPGRAAFGELVQKADGWAAGLVLLGETARRGEAWAAAGGGRRPAELFEYFANELFDRAAPAVQRLLLATSFLPSVPPALAERLAGEGAGSLLERLARDNFFTTRRTGSAPVYQYHPLFRAFLRARAEHALAPGERAALQRRAAALLDEAGQPEEAVALLQEAADGAAASALLLRLAPALEAQGRLQTLEGWIRELPAEVRDGDPWMLHWLGVCRMLFDPRESLALHERAFAAFQARGDDAGSLAAWTGATEAIFFAWSDFAALDPWIRWLDERVRRSPELPGPVLAARVTASMVSRLCWRQPSHPDLPAWAGRLEAILERIVDPNARARVLLTLVWYRAWIGDPAALDPAVEALERAHRAPGVPAATRIFCLRLASVALNYATFDPERSLARAEEALRLAAAEGLHAHDHWLHASAAIAHLSRNDAASAAPHLEAIRRAAGAAHVTDGHYLQVAAWQAWLLGDLDGALALGHRALQAVEKGGFTMARTQVNYQLAQLHRVHGDRAAATSHLAVAEETAAAGRSAIYVWACRLVRAQLALDAGDRAACRALLAPALAEGRARGFTNVPWWSTPLALSGLCEEALDAGVEPEYVGRLIRLHGLAPDLARPGAERWPFPVKIHALGPFVLERGEGHVQQRLTGHSKPLELLKALVALGGRDVPEAAILELLWPDAEGDRARQRLKFTLHSLRRLLGPVDAVSLDKGLLSLDPRRVWLDAWTLEGRLARLGAALERRQLEELRALLEQLLVERGALLEGEVAPWAIAARARLRGRVLRRVLPAVAALAEADPAAAAPLADRARELFPDEDRLRRPQRGRP